MEKKKGKRGKKISRGFFTVMDFMTVGLGLKGAELLVFSLMYSFGYMGEEVLASREYISDITGLSLRSVERGIATLRDMKYIIYTGRGGESEKQCRYIINLDLLAEELDRAHWSDSDEDELVEEREQVSDKRKRFLYSYYRKRCVKRGDN